MIYINEKIYENGHYKNGAYFDTYERDVICSCCGLLIGKQEAIVDKRFYGFRTGELANEYIYCYRCGHKFNKHIKE